MSNNYRLRRIVAVLASLIIFVFAIISNSPIQTDKPELIKPAKTILNQTLAVQALKLLEIKGRAPKTNYSRDQFGASWNITAGCDTRNIILNRDLVNVTVDDKCSVTGGTLHDPYTGKDIIFKRGSDTSSAVQIDHVVALSDAWQKGAQQLSSTKRIELANDPLELLAVDGPANLQKSDGDVATWLPSNKSFRCQYIARQIAVKQKYNLWVTSAEHDVMVSILDKCPGQLLPNP